MIEQFHATTVLCVRKDGKLAIGGDGQVTLGNTVMKGTAMKMVPGNRAATVTGLHTC